ncbi:MAG: SLC13 family permease [Proteobacteria bacterium]|nr:SLC13 family permease [Pseudomonadota bacterium]
MTVFENYHMWFVLALTLWAAASYVRERLPIEVTSAVLLTVLLVFGQLFPVEDAIGRNKLDATSLFAGFSNPALIAVLALLVMGQGIVQTDALRPFIGVLMTSNRTKAMISTFFILLFVMSLSAFMNNTPLVVLAIPVIQALAQSARFSESRVMMPLSFVAILGGMTTLVGSSTNMLVSSAMRELGQKPLQFFDFTVPGAMLAGVGFLYVIFVLPRLVPVRKSLTKELVGTEKEFVAEIDITKDSKLVGTECVNGVFPKLPGLNVRLIQRSGHLILPPFEGYIIEPGDVVIVAATRDALARILSQYPGYLLSEEEEASIQPLKAAQEPEIKEKNSGDGSDAQEDDDTEEGNKKKTVELDEKVADTRVLAEVMINPNSRMIDMTIEQVNFPLQFGAFVLGVQRRARVVKRRLGRVRLEAGDVLLMVGSQGAIDAMRGNQDMTVFSGSKKELPVPKKAPVSVVIMLGTIGLAATGVLSIPVASFAGAVLMIATGCLNIRQALRAVDRKIFLLVGSMLALGAALQATDGAQFIATGMLSLPFLDTPFAAVSALFITIAILTNILSNNACAILFTPIAMNMAASLGVHPLILAVTVVFAANCSFASPIGYKTNLLVMGPGHYRFKDFIKAGVPLILLLWVSFMIIAKYYYGL